MKDMTTTHPHWDEQRTIDFGMRWIFSRLGQITAGVPLPRSLALLDSQREDELENELDQGHVETVDTIYHASRRWLSATHERRLEVIVAIHAVVAEALVRSDPHYGGLEKACGLYDTSPYSPDRVPWRLFSDMDSAMDSAMDDFMAEGGGQPTVCDIAEALDAMRGRSNR